MERLFWPGLLCLFFLLAPAMVVKAEEKSGLENFTFSGQTFQVELRLPESARSGETVHLLTTLTPDDFPPSVYKKITLTWVTRPQGPEPQVLTGVPEADITFAVPGEYTVDVEVGLLSKGSCGAVAYRSLSVRRMSITVE